MIVVLDVLSLVFALVICLWVLGGYFVCAVDIVVVEWLLMWLLWLLRVCTFVWGVLAYFGTVVVICYGCWLVLLLVV